MSATVTVTGVAGPAIAVTAEVFEDVVAWHQNCETNILTLYLSSGKIFEVDITAAGTYTVTKSGSTYTVTIS